MFFSCGSTAKEGCFSAARNESDVEHNNFLSTHKIILILVNGGIIYDI